MNDDIRSDWPVVLSVNQVVWRCRHVTLACSWDRSFFRMVQKKTQPAYDFQDDRLVRFLYSARTASRFSRSLGMLMESSDLEGLAGFRGAKTGRNADALADVGGALRGCVKS
jgi:hypothetical protein